MADPARTIAEKIRANTAGLLDRLGPRPQLLPYQAALAMARERLAAAETYHRHY